MKIFKKITISITIIMTLLFSLIPPKIIYADTSAGNSISATAIDFYNNHTNVAYSLVDSHRENAYLNITTDGKYKMDCVGFVSMIIHSATELGESTFTIFATPRNSVPSGVSAWSAKRQYFQKVTDGIMPGDIICWYSHVGIAVGDINGDGIIDVIHCVHRGVVCESINLITTYLSRVNSNDATYNVVRITDSGSEVSKLHSKWYMYGQGSDNGGDNPTPVTPTPYVPDESDKYITTNTNGIGDSKKFYYNGAPLSGEYLGQTKSNWLIDALADVMDWLVGIITLGYKIQIVGWSTIFQSIANSFVNSITQAGTDGVITSEKILFNEVQILDVNFFDLKNAAGEQIQQGDVVYTLRTNVASLYYNIRNIVIIVMLVILLYVGIRMAIASIAKDKAAYRKMMLGWIVGFIVVMFIHYYMVIIMDLNEVFITQLKPDEAAGTVMYDQARAYAYEIPASKGWTGTIVYVFLIYYLIKLLIFYFKRLFVVYTLVLMAPILGAAYALEMIKGKSKSLTTWMKEFAFNVLIQTIHVIIYSIFMTFIFELMKKTNVMSLLGTSIIMVLIINLMLRAEKIIKKIFGLKANTMKDVIDTMLSASSTLVSAVALATPLYGMAKGKVVDAHAKSIERRVNKKYENLEKLYGKEGTSQLSKDIQREIERQKQIEKEQILKYDANSMKFAKGILSGMGGLIASVPMTFEQGPLQGALGTVGAFTNLNTRASGRITQDMDIDVLNKLSKKYGFDSLDMSHDLVNIKLPIDSKIAFANIDETKRYNTNAIVVEAMPGVSKEDFFSEIAKLNKQDGKNKIIAKYDGKTFKTWDKLTQNKFTTEDEMKKAYDKKVNKKNIKKPKADEDDKLNTKKVKKYRLASIATARNSTRVRRIVQDGELIKNGKLNYRNTNDLIQTRKIELLYQMKERVIEEEKGIISSIEELRAKGFPPIYYTPSANDTPEMIKVNMALKEEYLEQLQLYLEQAMAGDPKVNESSISSHIAEYTLESGHKPSNLSEMQNVIQKIAEDNDYEIGNGVVDNIKLSISDEVIKKLQDRQTNINVEKVKEELVSKIASAMERNEWDKTRAESELRSTMNNELTNEVIQSLSANEVVDIINSAVSRVGTIKKKTVSPEFEDLVSSVEKIAEVNNDAIELDDEPIVDTEELINNILNDNFE